MKRMVGVNEDDADSTINIKIGDNYGKLNFNYKFNLIPTLLLQTPVIALQFNLSSNDLKTSSTSHSCSFHAIKINQISSPTRLTSHKSSAIVSIGAIILHLIYAIMKL